LFAGFSVEQLAVPGAYPASCSPQAWASASPLLWLRTLLRLSPSVPLGELRVAPALPDSIRRLTVERIQLGAVQVDIDVEADDVNVTITGPGLEIIQEPRPASSPAIGGE
jgi:glycogen debranching enzyme